MGCLGSELPDQVQLVGSLRGKSGRREYVMALEDLRRAVEEF